MMLPCETQAGLEEFALDVSNKSHVVCTDSVHQLGLAKIDMVRRLAELNNLIADNTDRGGLQVFSEA